MCGFLCIFRAFLVVRPLFRCLLLFVILAAPPFLRSNLFRCSGASSILSLLCVLCPVVSVFLVSVPPPFLQPLPIPFISLLCTAPDTCPIFSLYAFHPGTSSSLLSLLSFLSPSLGFPFPLCVFSASLPHLTGAIPPFSPPPFPPLPPSFPRFPSPSLLSFPLLRFPLRKKFPLKSCMISSVKYMFYSIFLACLWKFS